MYIDLLRNKILEQEEVYKFLRENRADIVCYKEFKDGELGIKDANYTNRMSLFIISYMKK